MKEGASNEVRIKFRANPQPNAGQWRLGKITVPIGAESVDKKFKSTGIEKGVRCHYFGSFRFRIAFDLICSRTSKANIKWLWPLPRWRNRWPERRTRWKWQTTREPRSINSTSRSRTNPPQVCLRAPVLSCSCIVALCFCLRPANRRWPLIVHITHFFLIIVTSPAFRSLSQKSYVPQTYLLLWPKLHSIYLNNLSHYSNSTNFINLVV